MDGLIPAECKVIDPPPIDPLAELKAIEDLAEAEHGEEIEDLAEAEHGEEIEDEGDDTEGPDDADVD